MDDATAAPPLDEAPGDELRELEGGGEVDRDRRVPLLAAVLERAAQRRDAGPVKQDVDRARELSSSLESDLNSRPGANSPAEGDPAGRWLDTTEIHDLLMTNLGFRCVRPFSEDNP